MEPNDNSYKDHECTSSLVLSIESNEMDQKDQSYDVSDKDHECISTLALSIECYERGENQEAIRYGQQCIEIAKEADNDSIEMNACLVIAKACIAIDQCDEALPYAIICLDIANMIEDKEIENETLFLLGETYFTLKQFEEAVAYFKICNDISEETGDKERQMQARLKLSEVYEFLSDEKYREAKMDNYMQLSVDSYKMGQHTKAIYYGMKCLVVAKETGNQTAEMNSCLVIGKAYGTLGWYNEGIPYFMICLKVARKTGDEEIESETSFLLGETHFKSKQFEEAIRYFEMCNSISQRTSDKKGQMQAHLKLAELYELLSDVKYREAKMNNYMELRAECYKMGKNSEAIDYGKKSLDMAKETGNQHAEIKACLGIGEAYSALEQHVKANQYARIGLDIAKETGDRHSEMEAYLAIGRSQLALEDYDKSIEATKMFLDIAKEINDNEAEMKAYMFVGVAYLEKKQYGKAIQYFRMYLDIASAMDSQCPDATAYTLLGKSHLSLGFYEDAAMYYRVSLDIAQETGNKENEMMVCIALGKLHFELKDYDNAIKYARMYLDTANSKGFDGDAYSLLCDAYYCLGEYEDCISCFKMYFDLEETEGNKENEASNFLSQDHQYKEAVPYWKRCIEMAMENGNKIFLTMAYFHLGETYFKLDKYDKSVDYYKKTIHVAKEIDDNKKVEMKASLQLAELYKLLNQNEEGLLHAENALQIAKELCDKKTEIKAYSLLVPLHRSVSQESVAIRYIKELGATAKESGDSNSHMQNDSHHDAILHWQSCIDEATQTSDKEGLKMAYFHLGETYFKLNKYDDSLDFYKMALRMAKESGDKETELKVSFQLAEMHILLNQNEKAVLHANMALQSATKIGDNNAEMKAYFLCNSLRRSCQQESEVIKYTNELIATAKERGDVHGEVLGYQMESTELIKTINSFPELSDMAHQYLDISVSAYVSCPLIPPCNIDHLNLFIYETQKWLKQLLELNYDSVTMKILMDEFLHHSNLNLPLPMLSTVSAMAIEKLKDQPETDQEKSLLYRYCACFQQEMKSAITQLTFSTKQISFEDFMLNLEEYLNIFLLLFIFFGSLDSQAVCHSCCGLLNFYLGNKTKAKKSLMESVSCFEATFLRLDVAESKISIFDRHVDTYKLLFKMLIEEDQKEEALLVSERCRAQALRDVLRLKYGMKLEKPGDDGGQLKLTDIKSLLSKSNKYSILFYSVYLNEVHTISLDNEKELHLLVNPLEHCGTYDLEQHIEDAFTEIEVPYLFHDAKALYEDIQGVKIFESFPAEKQEAIIDRIDEKLLLLEINSGLDFGENLPENSDESSFTNALEVLYNKLLGEVPIEQDEIVIIPDGPLFNVPFAALRDPGTGRYLSEDKRIRLAPSLTTLKLLSDRPTEDKKKVALVIGDPEVGKVMFDGKEGIIERLDNAHVEALVMGYRYGVKPLIGSAATKPSVIEKLRQGEYSVVHIAAHGDLDKATILLAPSPETRKDGKIPDEEDYMLTMADVQKAQVSAQLIVLSCCYSGRGKIRAEGVVGMCRAFLASGARAVVASLWAIDDEATNEFMSIFSEYLRMGKSASMSLHLTMNEMRTTSRYNKPKHWAPFFLMGDDVTIRF